MGHNERTLHVISIISKSSQKLRWFISNLRWFWDDLNLAIHHLKFWDDSRWFGNFISNWRWFWDEVRWNMNHLKMWDDFRLVANSSQNSSQICRIHLKNLRWFWDEWRWILRWVLTNHMLFQRLQQTIIHCNNVMLRSEYVPADHWTNSLYTWSFNTGILLCTMVYSSFFIDIVPMDSLPQTVLNCSDC